MIKITYFARNDPEKLSAPYWQVGYQNPQEKYQFTSIAPYTHYSKGEAHNLARLLNEAVKRYVDVNDIPQGDSEKLLAINTMDPNDMTESQKSLDILSMWLSDTERLGEHLKGSLVEKILQVKDMILNLLEAVENVDLKKDSMGNWKAYKKNR